MSVFTHAQVCVPALFRLIVRVKKMKTANVIATVILVTMWRYVQFCYNVTLCTVLLQCDGMYIFVTMWRYVQFCYNVTVCTVLLQCDGMYSFVTMWRYEQLCYNVTVCTVLLQCDGMYSFVTMWRYVQFCTFFTNPLHCTIPDLTVQWQSLYGPFSTVTVSWIFHTNAFKLWLCDLLQYQNHKQFLIATLPKHCCVLPLPVAYRYVGCLKCFVHLSTAQLAYC
jgi:hypothetical protein